MAKRVGGGVVLNFYIKRKCTTNDKISGTSKCLRTDYSKFSLLLTSIRERLHDAVGHRV